MSPTLLLDFEARYCFEPELFWEAAQDTEPTERLTLADVPWRLQMAGCQSVQIMVLSAESLYLNQKCWKYVEII